MHLKPLVAALLAALIITAGAAGTIAATPGNAPDDAGSQGDDHAANESENSDTSDDQMNETARNHSEDDPQNASDRANESAAAAQEERGPPVDMPANVPDHVRQIHAAIRSHLTDNFDSLGSAISGILSDGGAAADEHADANETATPSPTATATPA